MDTKARITEELRIRTLKLEATSRKTIDAGNGRIIDYSYEIRSAGNRKELKKR